MYDQEITRAWWLSTQLLGEKLYTTCQVGNYTCQIGNHITGQVADNTPLGVKQYITSQVGNQCKRETAHARWEITHARWELTRAK